MGMMSLASTVWLPLLTCLPLRAGGLRVTDPLPVPGEAPGLSPASQEARSYLDENDAQSVQDMERRYRLEAPQDPLQVAEFKASVADWEGALQIWREWIRSHPDAPETPDVLRQVVDLEKSLGDLGAAAADLQTLATR